MNRITFNDGGEKLTRISKTKARKLWGTLRMSFCPCNLRPGGPWRPNVTFFVEQQKGQSFDQAVNAFEWYNCTGRETGTYTAFYLVNPGVIQHECNQ